ncbi:MAG TPA: hypothetical protein PLD58_11180 [Phycisphaerae bacterium]|nr:hypothetical protein [Phycisphaerae bacterium]
MKVGARSAVPVPVIIPILLIIPILPIAVLADEPVGKRPYEMDWAGRSEDVRPPLVDFEDLDGWTVQTKDSVAAFVRSREQQLWGRHVGKLVYRGTGPQPVVTLRPPKPIRFAGGVDCVNLWAYGNNWAWQSDASTPRVRVSALLQPAKGPEQTVTLATVNFKEWHLLHARLRPEQIEAFQAGGALTGIQIAGGRNAQDRELFFDNLAVYREQLAPLTFEPRPQRNIALLPGQSPGTNTGPGKLPFPAREETILPDNLTGDFEASLEEADKSFIFTYRGRDGVLSYVYRPGTGQLGDIVARWGEGGREFRPLAGGGARLWRGQQAEGAEPDKVELLSCRREGQTVVTRWKLTTDNRTAEVACTLRLWQKSLVIDVICPGGEVGEVRFGRAEGLDNPRLVTLPYLTGDWNARPAVAVSGPADRPLFVMGVVDHCRSNASALFFLNRVAEGGATYNGGARYLARTDGRRNDCYERLFLTVSPRFEEVLPNVPNPPSPWMHVAGERVWRAHGAHNRQADYDLWKRVVRYGMTKIALTDHETGWRDCGESFTFRTRAAPGKGGDEGQVDYARKIRALGIRYGIYNNYTDFAPVNGHWHEDRVTRTGDGGWRTAWARCYNPKPARAVEFEARLAPIIQRKFQLDTAYCDVHTAVRPWDYVDYDARVPGAGTFAATFYAYGEIMLHQKATWNGPVYSEGNNHWYYCGLTDGNYGQDQSARLDNQPWLVDFDLRKLHPLCCNFGMGNLQMFDGGRLPHATPEQADARLDRFLAATLAFGHTGFLTLEGGMGNASRSYFLLQQVHARYARERAEDIRYADESGKLLDVSAAVAGGAYRRSQVVTRYTGGLTVTVNGHSTATWDTGRAVLPPNGWHVHDETHKLTAWSANVEDRRADYVDSPAYLYGDGRGRLVRLPRLVCDGPLIVLKRDDGKCEMIPVAPCRTMAAALEGRSASAVALDEAGKELGPAEVRFSRGFVHVMPLAGAFSYLLTPQPAPTSTATCDRLRVVPGETVKVAVGGRSADFRVPADAKIGQQAWHKAGDAWIDFEVVPLARVAFRWDGAIRVALVPSVDCEKATVELAGRTETVRFATGRPLELAFAPAPAGAAERVLPLMLKLSAGELGMNRPLWLKTERELVPLGGLGEHVATGQCLRGGKETPIQPANRTQVLHTERACGGVEKPCLFMHPPYAGGVGYAFAAYRLALPAGAKAALRCSIGKADGGDRGDGIAFKVAVVAADGKETLVAQRQWTEFAWGTLEADLSPWAGKEVTLKLIADVGPADDSSADWACWADLRLESLTPQLRTTLHERAVSLRRRPGPHAAKASLDELRKARRAVLHFEGIGLQNGPPYVSQALLNQVPLGDLPSAGGDERKGVWTGGQLPVPPAALAELKVWNTLTIRNSGRDNFAVRNFWVEFELSDGRKVSSEITTPAYRQPPAWPHGEGTGVPFERDIELEIVACGN